MAESLALSKDEQTSFFKDVKSIKKLIKDGQLKVKDDKAKKQTLPNGRVNKRGIVYMGHLPPGFDEDAMKSYFKQFGSVSRVRLVRSLRTGKSRGYGYVEFVDTDVAKIVAETMNNYLMKNRLLKATYIPAESQHKGFFAGKTITEKNTPLNRVRRKEFNRKNRNLAVDEKEDELERHEASLKKIQKKMAAAGVSFDIVHKGESVLPSSCSSEIANGSTSKNKSQKNKKALEKKTDVKQGKKNVAPKRFVQPPSDDDESDDAISWDGKSDSDSTGDDLDESVEEETKHNFVKMPLKSKNVKKKKNNLDSSTSSITPPKSKNNKKQKATAKLEVVSPVPPSPKQKKNKNAKKSKSDGDIKNQHAGGNNKLIQKKKSGGIEKQKPKNKKGLISNDKKLKMAAAEIMKVQEVPKLKDQKLKIKSKKNKKQ